MRVDVAMLVHIEVGEVNRGRVIGVQTEVIQGDVIAKEIYQPQVYVLSGAGRAERWDRFIKENTPPYKFLAPYTAQDKVLFKGRDQEIDQVVERIGEQPLLVVYGQAGVGKTSLLAAGVIPRLAESGALVVDIPDYRQPVKAIRAALIANAEQIPISLPDDLTLPALLRAVEEQVQGTLVLVFDQFEALFEPSVDPEHRTAFIKELSESLQTIEPESLRVIIAVREEALSHLAELRNRLPDLWLAPFHLLPLNTPEARAAILEPLEVLENPVPFADKLVDQFLVPDLDDLSREKPGQIFPPHLQIVCHRLYQEARQRHLNQINSRLYDDEMKGAEGIMARYLEDTLETQLAADRPLAVRVLTAMASPGVKPWVSPEQLPLNGDPPERLFDVLKRLEVAVLLASRPANGWHEYAFTSQSVAMKVRSLQGLEAERRYQAGDELERIWGAWLARDAPATREQLRYLAEASPHLTPRAVQSLLLLRSAVTRDEPVGPWLAWLRSDEGYALIRQLEEPQAANLTRYNSRSDLKRAASLLGLADVTLPKQPGDQPGPFGPIAWCAVIHPDDSIVRQTAALALMSLPGHEGLNRLDEALREGLQGWRRRQRRAELYGTLADGDPEHENEIKNRYSDLPFLDRISLWLWRARRRLFRDRDRVAWLTVGGAIGAGLGLGLLRAVIEALAPAPNAVFVGPQFAIYFYCGAILGAALSLGMALAEPLLLSRHEKTGETPPIWRAPLHPDRLPAVVAATLGTLFFWLGHAIITFFNSFPSLSNILDPLRAPMVLVAGLGLNLALYGCQPRINQSQSLVRRLLRPSTAPRLATAALTFVLVEWLFITQGKGPALNIAWSTSAYKSKFLDYIMTRDPRWPEYLALLDAALVGLVLTIGLTAGLALAANWLARWRALVKRAGD